MQAGRESASHPKHGQLLHTRLTFHALVVGKPGSKGPTPWLLTSCLHLQELSPLCTGPCAVKLEHHELWGSTGNKAPTALPHSETRTLTGKVELCIFVSSFVTASHRDSLMLCPLLLRTQLAGQFARWEQSSPYPLLTTPFKVAPLKSFSPSLGRE